MLKGQKVWLLFVVVGGMALSALYMNMSRALLTPNFEVFISPSGNDANDGLSAKTPILTLKRANAIALKQLQTRPTDVVVHVAPGAYFNQTVSWTAVHKDFYVIIKGTSPTSRAKFDGRLNSSETLGTQHSFFTLSARGFLTNLTLENLHITYYVEAVSFAGNREDAQNGYNGNNKILNTVFDRIGNQYSKVKDKIGYAVVRFSNSRFNTVRGNIFSNLYNGAKNEYQHALYISSHSGSNTITQNAFRNNGGDPVRIRDFSNFNKIDKNEFNKAGAVGYSEWYCEQASEPTCTKADPECPSWGNTFTGNNLKSVGTHTIYINPNFVMSRSACKRAAPAEAGGKRVSTSGNFTNATVLVTSSLNGGLYSNFCSALTDCVSSSGKCYRSGQSSTRWLCDANRWRSCSKDSEVGKVYQGRECRKEGDLYLWK